MHRRRAALIGLFALLVLLSIGGPAAAHRLDADASVRIVQKVRIESFYSDDTRPKGAEIEVYYENEEKPHHEGTLDDEGTYEFIADPQPLRVVILAGDGHTKELFVTPAVVDTSSPVWPIEHRTHVPWVEALAGLGFLFGAAALVISLRNARRLSALHGK
jgi:hypothetical protein